MSEHLSETTVTTIPEAELPLAPGSVEPNETIAESEAIVDEAEVQQAEAAAASEPAATPAAEAAAEAAPIETAAEPPPLPEADAPVALEHEVAPELVPEVVPELVPEVVPELVPEVVAEAAQEPAAILSVAADAPAPVAAVAPVVEPVVAPVAEAVAEPEESFADIFSEFQRTHNRRAGQVGSQIRGTVINVTDESVFVDIGFKSEGILPVAAFTAKAQTVKAGDSLQVSVKGRDLDGYYELSLFKTAQPKDWSSLERAFENKSTIVGTVSAVVKGGLHVDVGVRAFLPASRSGTRDAAELEKMVGQEIRCRITKLDVADEDVVVDRRIVTEEEALESKARRYAEVAEGALVDGTVRSLTDYGAFVDLGGVDGLLHISDISWSRVSKASDVLTVGQQLELKVLKIDPDGRRISLGLKQLQPHPWDAVAARYAVGDRVRGTVSRIAEFGAFVELEPGVDGLVHLSEMSWSRRILKATEVVQMGDSLEAVILAINLPEKRISLGLKQALGDPWVEAGARLTPGSIVEGPVASMTKFGAFIQAAQGVEGMVHISEIVADRRLNHPSDALRLGEVVKAMVLEIDKEKRQLRLSIKQLIPTSLDEFLAEHAVGDTVTGRVVSVESNVARVELGEGIQCTCTLPVAVEAMAAPVVPEPAKVDLSAFSAMLKTKWKTGAAAGSGSAARQQSAGAEAGQVRKFRITQLDAAQKKIAIELLP